MAFPGGKGIGKERERMTVFVIEVDHHTRGWIRIGRYYRKKATAKSWLSFVKAAWNGLPARITTIEAEIGEKA